MKEHKKIDGLRWVRVFTPVHIPKYLVDQIRDRDYSVEDFYKYQEQCCLRNTPDGPSLNPLNHLYVLANDENLTKGFVWFTIDTLSKDICIQIFSMDKEYWGKGHAVERLSSFIKDILRKAKLNKVYWVTNYEKHSLRHGFKRSKSILMEYTEEENGKNFNGPTDSGAEHRSVDKATTTVSTECDGIGERGSSRSGIRELTTTV